MLLQGDTGCLTGQAAAPVKKSNLQRVNMLMCHRP